MCLRSEEQACHIQSFANARFEGCDSINGHWEKKPYAQW